MGKNNSQDVCFVIGVKNMELMIVIIGKIVSKFMMVANGSDGCLDKPRLVDN